MARAAPGKKIYFEQFEKEFDPKYPAGVYLICGDEEFLKWKAQQILLQGLVDEATRDFNYDCHSAAEVTAPDVIAMCNTVPFGSGRRVVRLTDCNRISASFKKQLAGFFPHIPEYTTLIMIFGAIRSETGFHKAAMAHGVYLNCIAPFPTRIPDFAATLLSEAGFEARRGVVDSLLEMTGNDLYSINNEVEKLRLWLKDKKKLTEESIHQFASVSDALAADEYLDALGRKNLAAAVSLANGTLLRKDSALTMIFKISSMFSNIYAGLNADGDISYQDFFKKRVGYKKARDYSVYIGNFNKRDVEKIFSLLFFAEWEAKLNPTPGQQLLQVLSYYICKTSLYDGRNPFPAYGRIN